MCPPFSVALQNIAIVPRFDGAPPGNNTPVLVQKRFCYRSDQDLLPTCVSQYILNPSFAASVTLGSTTLGSTSGIGGYTLLYNNQVYICDQQVRDSPFVTRYAA